MATILVVDDEDVIRSILRKVLEGAGHTVFDAKDGRQALKMYADSPTDLVISDIFMPEMDGIEFLMRVRDKFPEARIIALSGGGYLGKAEVLTAASNLGAVTVLEKPFEVQDCLALVEWVLEKG